MAIETRGWESIKEEMPESQATLDRHDDPDITDPTEAWEL